MLVKARELPADEVVIDLEDSVEAGAKDRARAAAAEALAADWGGRAVAVRINAVGGEWWQRDVSELTQAGSALSSFVVPKCKSAADLERVAAEIGEASTVGLQALIETAAGLVDVGEIAASSRRLETLIVGYADLAASLGRPAAPPDRGDSWAWVRETVLVHARAAGLAAIDGPHLAIEDADGLRTAAELARASGYDGKWAIHPDQLPVLTEIFSPTATEIERARAVLGALDSAAGTGTGAAALEGEMIDEASRKQAALVIARAEAGGDQRAGTPGRG